jgi:hypothetical protein
VDAQVSHIAAAQTVPLRPALSLSGTAARPAWIAADTTPRADLVPCLGESCFGNSRKV